MRKFMNKETSCLVYMQTILWYFDYIVLLRMERGVTRGALHSGRYIRSSGACYDIVYIS